MSHRSFALRSLFLVALLATVAIALAACGSGGKEKQTGGTDTLILGAYTVPKDAYEKEVVPAFQKYWKEKTGRDVTVQQSYEASGAQARAVVAGFEADVVALSLEDDVDKVVQAGLITHDWKSAQWHGFITRSVVSIATRPGNPKNIRTWMDLTRDDVEVLYPNPKTSGGAMWDVNAIYGAGLKMSEKTTGKPDPAFARDLLKRIQKRVKVMDKSGRESVTTFERGIGDALVTYENEILLRRLEGKDMPFVTPDATILIENPAALVDRNADKHGVRPVAEAFVQFLRSDAAQRSFARYGFRPASPKILAEFKDKYPEPPQLFDMSFLGGWPRVREDLYGAQGIWTKITQELAQE